MEVYSGILLVLFYFQPVFSSPMNYVYYENPDLGYVASLSGPSAYTKTRLNGPKKFFVGNTNQKYMKLANEEAINSLFNIGKFSHKMFDPVIDTNNVNAPKFTEDDKSQTKPEINNQDVRFVEVDQSKQSRDADVNHKNSKLRMTPESNIKEVQKPHIEGKPLAPKNYFEYRLKQNKRRASFKTIPKIQYDLNQPPIKKSQLPIQKYGERSLTKPSRDMTYKQSDKKYNNQAMTTILDDMTQKALERYEQNQEQKKRETHSTLHDDYPQPAVIQPFGRDNRVKFLDSKHIPARIGKYEESLSGRPYALFYRGLENLDHRDFYTGSVDKSLHNNVVESKMLVKDITLDRERKRKARKISNIKLNRNSLD